MKGKLLLLLKVLHALLFVLFYKSMLSMEGAPLDKWFYVGYANVVLITIIVFVFLKNKKSMYIATGISAAVVLGLFVGYFVFDRVGYKIGIEDVEKIEYIIYGENYKIVEADTDVVKDILEEYNDNTCIKRWDGGGQIGTPEDIVIIYLKNGAEVSFAEDCVVQRDGKTYRSTFDYDKIVEYIEK
jgi:hypothetical protein